MERVWKNAIINPPIDSDRYWCYVEEVTENGKSYFQWNCSYNPNDGWNVDMLEHLGAKVLYYTELLDDPRETNT